MESAGSAAPITIGPNRRNSWAVTERVCDLRRPGSGQRRPWPVAARRQDLIMDPARSGLIVVDMQNDFCHPRGWLASIGVDVSPTRQAVDPLGELLDPLRASGVAVVWVNWGVRPDRANLPPGVLHVYNPDGRQRGLGDQLDGVGPVLAEGSWGAQLVDGLHPAAGEPVVAKHRMSGFWDTPLDSVLRNLDLTTLLFAGVNVDQCVLATLVDAACVGYDCVLVEDCCATTSPAYCWDATRYNVEQCFGFVTTSQALRQGLTGTRKTDQEVR